MKTILSLITLGLLSACASNWQPRPMTPAQMQANEQMRRDGAYYQQMMVNAGRKPARQQSLPPPPVRYQTNCQQWAPGQFNCNQTQY